MQQLKEKLRKISDVWNDYVFELDFFQRKINFTKDVQTNYFCDILRFFEDTLISLKIRKTKVYEEQVFNMIGLLQVIYIQQDLTDEMLYIFKLQQSSAADKNPNRELRNELIGHPVRRRKFPANELLSSVFFSRDLTADKIHYIRYAKENNFSGKSTFHSMETIINSHINFLHKQLDRILYKLDTLLSIYREKVKMLQSMITAKVQFPKIADFTSKYYEAITEHDYLYKKEILLECFARKKEHPRYNYAITDFMATLRRYVKETGGSINTMINRKFTPKKKKRLPVIKVVFAQDKHMLTEDQREANFLQYELSKLHDRKHHVYDIRYFREKYGHNKKVAAELTNMEQHHNNTLEYYASFRYLKFLMVGNYLLINKVKPLPA